MQHRIYRIFTDSMPQDTRRLFKQTLLKVALFDAAILLVLTALSVLFVARSKTRLAEQLAESFRAPLIAGDNRQIILDMPRPVLKDFRGVIWHPEGNGYTFSVPANLRLSDIRGYGSLNIEVFFDEHQSIKAGRLEFIFNRWEALPPAVISWLLLVTLSLLIGHYEWKRLLREYRLSIESQINETRATMAAQVAHDIRSPLVALDAALENTAALPERQRAIVRHSLNRIRDVANGLLEKNRQQPGAAESNTVGASESLIIRPLSSLLDSVIAEKRAQHGSMHGIVIDFRLTSDSYGVFAMVEPVEFSRMISNLVNNAVEALGEKGKVDVRLSQEEKTVLLTISDDGRGIPAEILAKLGKKGETHGKAGGSGLGLFHARTTAESWGGSLEITSTSGKGTSVTIRLPKAQAPANFVAALELIPGKPVLVLDDDQGIHGLWRDKLEPAGLKEHNIEVVYFSEPSGLRAWVKAEPSKAKTALCLFDYELSGHNETGLNLAEELGLCPRTILVTGRSEEKRIIEECARLKVRSIPKGLLEFVPVKVGAPRQAVLLDDDQIVHMNWETAAEEAGIELKSYKTPDELLGGLGAFSKATPIYIDSELGVDVKGEDIAAALKEKGFTDLTLVTGYSPERFTHLSWLKVRGKESPWRA